ncbi:hypothetical protein QEN19_000445 [Hanseniaspora menglaensis]
MASKTTKTRQFTGCWTCRYKKRKCDTSNFSHKKSCKNCLKSMENCTFHVKLTWKDVNSIMLNNINNISNFQELLNDGRNSVTQAILNKKVKKEKSTISDRRFQVYNTENKLINISKNANDNFQKNVDKKMNNLLSILEKRTDTQNFLSYFIGPFGAFKSVSSKKQKCKKIATQTSTKLTTEKYASRLVTKSTCNIISKSNSLQNGNFQNIEDLLLYPDEHVSPDIDVLTLNSVTRSSNSLNSLIDLEYAQNIFQLDCNYNIINAVEYDLAKVNETNNFLSKDFFLNSDSFFDFSLEDDFLEALNVLPHQNTTDLSNLGRNLLESLQVGNKIFKKDKLSTFLSWCLNKAYLPMKNNIPILVFDILEKIEFDLLNHDIISLEIDSSCIEFMNLACIGLMLKELIKLEFGSLLIRWFNVLISLNRDVINNRIDDTLYETFIKGNNIKIIFVLVQFYFDNEFYNVMHTHADLPDLICCEKILNLLLKNSYNIEINDQKQLINLKNKLNKKRRALLNSNSFVGYTHLSDSLLVFGNDVTKLG